MKNPPPGIRTASRYRTISEQQITDILLVAAFVYDLDAGERESAVGRIRSALDAWIKLGLGYQVTDRGERTFDPVEVINRMKWAGYQGLDDFWINHFVATGRAFFSEWNPPAGLLSQPRRRDPALFNIDLRRIFNLDGIDVGQKVRLRLPLPLLQSSQQLEVEPVVPPDLSARIIRSDGRLDFQFTAPPEPVVELAAKISFITDGLSRDDTPGSLPSNRRDIYLRANEGLVRVTPRIKALAHELADADRSHVERATTFFHYIIDELMCGMVHYDQVNADAPGDWILDNGWYDCQLGSALLVSMCLACGIPARILSGYMLYRLGPGFHYWAEIWLDEQGWIPFDFLTWDLSKGGHDVAWRNCFAGAIDYRMVTQCFPLSFTGPMSVRFPSAWHLINRPTCTGMDINFVELDGKPIYCDRVSVQKQPR